MTTPFDIVIIGLTITSSWGNGHATTYRGLVKGLSALGYKVLFLECDVEWYRNNREELTPDGATVMLYESFDELLKFEDHVMDAKLVIVGSYVQDGARIGEWVTSVARGRTAFYDIDTPVTLSSLRCGTNTYITPGLIPRYQAYFSFTGGPILRVLESAYGSPLARALYCVVDSDNYRPVFTAVKWDLGYLGTYSADRQASLDELLLSPARQWSDGRFVVAGAQYPEGTVWPDTVERTPHISPRDHPGFYGSQRFTLNITREAMKIAGFAPSVRLFEAGSCGVPIISDWWVGLDTIFKPGSELLVAESRVDVLRYLRDTPEDERKQMGQRARKRILSEHSPLARARQMEGYLKEMNDNFFSDSACRH